MGKATPHRIGRQIHSRAKPEVTSGETPRTGIDYLGLIAAGFEEETRRRISYSELKEQPPPITLDGQIHEPAKKQEAE